uniref:H open reading frame n=1 Tax=Toxolasma parvum TaxID=227614 RepID=F4ZGC9_TOXPA|nr:h open reading frame [Toxolasma parvum]ADL62651.1 h open reading frame [Toxolasma parvum]
MKPKHQPKQTPSGLHPLKNSSASTSISNKVLNEI